MRRALALGMMLAVAIAVPLLAAPPGPGNPVARKAVYTKKCGTCHGPAGEPKEAIAKMMKVEMRHLGGKEVQAKSDADLKKTISQGTGKMKGVAGISDKEMADLLAFVRSLAKK